MEAARKTSPVKNPFKHAIARKAFAYIAAHAGQRLLVRYAPREKGYSMAIMDCTYNRGEANAYAATARVDVVAHSLLPVRSYLRDALVTLPIDSVIWIENRTTGETYYTGIAGETERIETKKAEINPSPQSKKPVAPRIFEMKPAPAIKRTRLLSYRAVFLDGRSEMDSFWMKAYDKHEALEMARQVLDMGYAEGKRACVAIRFSERTLEPAMTETELINLKSR